MHTKYLMRTWNGKNIRQRADGWWSLTDMAASCDKLFGHWYDLQGTTAYITYAEAVIGNPITEIKQGGVDQGTWGHPKLAIKFAMWLSVPFEFAVTGWVEELLTEGKVTMGDTPIKDFEVVKAVEALAPEPSRILGNAYVSDLHLCSESVRWDEEMRRVRNRTHKDLRDNPKLRALKVAEIDAALYRGYARRNETMDAPYQKIASPTIEILITRNGKKVPMVYDRQDAHAILAPYHFVSVRFAAYLFDPEGYRMEHEADGRIKKIQWTAGLLRRLGWVSIKSNEFCLDPLDPAAPTFRSILWMREHHAVPNSVDAFAWSVPLDAAIESRLYHVPYQGEFVLDAKALVAGLNKDARVAVIASKSISVELAKRGWRRHKLLLLNEHSGRNMWYKHDYILKPPTRVSEVG